jgi:hypothetical protein
MILLDVNILIYAVNVNAPQHQRAKRWLEATISGKESVGLSWNVLLAFLRVTTRPGLFRNPLPPETAFDLIESWLEQPLVTVIHPGPRHLVLMRELLLPSGTGGNLTSDAHLAAMAIEQGAELCTSDSDFARFPRLKCRNPLT